MAMGNRPLEKKSVPINFAQGLDQKTDPFQVAPGKFLSLQNSVFTKGGLLQKRNGYGKLTALPNSLYTALTTFNGNLTAIGSSLSAYSAGSGTWVGRGSLQPAELSVIPVVRSNTNQTQADSVVAANGLMCTAFTDVNGSAVSYKYTITDSTTSQAIVSPTLIVPSAGTVTGAPRVFLLGNYFVIVYNTVVSATNHLQFMAVSTANPLNVVPGADISTLYTPDPNTLAFDGVVVSGNLYLAWNGASSDIRMTYITANLVQQTTISYAAHSCTIMSLCADTTGTGQATIWAAFYNSSGTTGYALAVNETLQPILAPTQIISTGPVAQLTSAAQNQILTFYAEYANNYGYDATIPTHFIKANTLTQAGVLGTPFILARSVGLASKAFIVAAKIYVLSAYFSVFQPTYFLLNPAGQVVSKFAYQNGGGYVTTGLPSANVMDGIVNVAYLYKDLIQSVNKEQGVANAAGIYSQTGINVAFIDLTETKVVSAEIGANLNLTGGILWAYDGATPTEQGFHLYPDNVEGTGHATGGAMLAQKYYYVWTYEWTDAQGNIQRSAPSIPLLVDASLITPTPITFQAVFSSGVSTFTVSSTVGLKVGQVFTDTTTPGNIQAGTYITSIVGSVITISLPTSGASAVSPGDTLSTSTTISVTLNIPTLRLTYKVANPVKLVGYRWSTAQENYYQTTSITSPLLNDPTIDYVTFTDTNADSSILGNSLVYTTGGVVENTGGPAMSSLTLFNNRLFGIDAEDGNLLPFSKQVIENTPVEMSDLLSIYVAPTTSAQGPTGPNKCLAPMDDKLIIYKKNAILYIAGSGPDNTGANSQYGDPVLITATVGSDNQQSIVFTPNGLMFQSDKGIWLLGRDLSTSYIGAPVEDFTTNAIVQSAVNVPGTNQVRFTLDSGITLMYDYYFQQWGTFVNVPAVSSTLYNSLHTYIDAYGRVFQETPGKYLDGSNPVLMSFTTSWLNLAGLQGFERAYELYLLGVFKSPHTLMMQIAYDYNSAPQQTTVISPTNYVGNYGSDTLYGGAAVYGGASNIEQWRVFFQKQKCQSFQISLQEVFDATKGAPAGAGLTISGLNMTLGIKGSRPKLSASRQVG